MKEGSHDDRLMLALKVSKPLTGAPGVLASLIATEAAGLSAAGWSGGPVDGLGTVGELVNLSGAGGLGGPMPEGVPALNMSQVGGSTIWTCEWDVGQGLVRAAARRVAGMLQGDDVRRGACRPYCSTARHIPYCCA
jgi:hypothetical protein